MKKLFFCFAAILLFLHFSCKETDTENNAIKMNQEGIDFMNAGKYELALKSFLKAIKSTKLSKTSKGTIYRNISLTYKELNKSDSAIHFSTLAAKCYKKNSFDYLVNTADVDLASGKISIGLKRLLKAVDLYPDEMIVNNTLGLIYLGDYDEAFIDLDKALLHNSKAFEIDGGRITEEVLGRTYYKMEDYKKAESHFQHLLQKYPDIAAYSMDMGMIKLKQNKNTEADKFFDRTMALDSSYKETISIFKMNNLPVE